MLPAGFEARLLGAPPVLAVAPADWVEGLGGLFLEPPEAGPGAASWGVRLAVDTNCDGLCEPKDWPAIAERIELAPLRRAPAVILRDEALDSGRLLVVEQDGVVTIALVRWRPGGDRYFVCRARLAGSWVERADDFVGACGRSRLLF